MKDNIKLQQNAVKALHSFIRVDFNPQLAEKVLEKISEKGVPLKKANNNYWAKKYIKFTEAKKMDTQLDFQKFAKMDYKELYNEAIG